MANTDIPFWITNPSILINKTYLTDLYPKASMSRNEKLNAISRLIIILTVIGFLLAQNYKILMTGIITLAIIVFLYVIQNRQLADSKTTIEGFEDLNAFKSNFTCPKKTNPLMNVLLPEYSDDPNREAAAPTFNPNVEDDINEKTMDFVAQQFVKGDEEKDKIKARLFADLGDNFEFNQSMRNFYATPNTTIPNDQGSFAEFLYGDMISCKEGNELACTRDNSRWINY